MNWELDMLDPSTPPPLFAFLNGLSCYWILFHTGCEKKQYCWLHSQAYLITIWCWPQIDWGQGDGWSGSIGAMVWAWLISFLLWMHIRWWDIWNWKQALWFNSISGHYSWGSVSGNPELKVFSSQTLVRNNREDFGWMISIPVRHYRWVIAWMNQRSEKNTLAIRYRISHAGRSDEKR